MSLASRAGDELLGRAQRLVHSAGHLIKDLIQPLDLPGDKRRRPGRLAGHASEVGDERLDVLLDLPGELLDAPGEQHPGDDGPHLNEGHDQHGHRDDADVQLAGLAHACSPRSLACWNASRPRSIAEVRVSR